MTQRERVRKAVAYMTKYTTKGDGVQMPRGLRLFGYGGLTKPGRAVRYWLCLPSWLIQRARSFRRVTRLPGGVWVAEDTGESWRSPWEFVRVEAEGTMVRFRRRGERPALLSAEPAVDVIAGRA
jgi:hypothetical protein